MSVPWPVAPAKVPVLSAPSAAQTALTCGPTWGWGHCRPASCSTSLPWLVVMVRMIRLTHWELVPHGGWLPSAVITVVKVTAP